ncbi:MAG: Fis family transcriptional regulator [Spirochaetota bacterium]
MKNKHIGSTLNSFLEEEGIAEEVESGAVKKLIAFQLRAALENEHMSKTELAARLQTSRAALDRLLDPDNDSVTLGSLKRAAEVLGKKLRLELV